MECGGVGREGGKEGDKAIVCEGEEVYEEGEGGWICLGRSFGGGTERGGRDIETLGPWGVEERDIEGLYRGKRGKNRAGEGFSKR